MGRLATLDGPMWLCTAPCRIRGGKTGSGESISRSKPTMAFHCQSLCSTIISGPTCLCIR